MPNSVESGRFLLALKIEGVGLPINSNTEGIYRWTTRRSLLDNPSTVDPQSLYKDGLLFWPSELGFSCDFKSGLATVGTQTFRLRGHDEIWDQVMLYQHGVLGKLAAAASATDAYVDLNTSGLAGGTVFLEREAILLGTESTVLTVYRYQTDGAGDGARGALGTTPTLHNAGVSDDLECFGSLNELSGRTVELVRVDMAAASPYAEEVLWTGVLRRVASPEPHVIEIQADSALSLLRGAKLMKQQWKGRVTSSWSENVHVWQALSTPHPPNVHPDAHPNAGHSGDRRLVVSDGDRCTVLPYGRIEAEPYPFASIYVHDVQSAAPFGQSPGFGAAAAWPQRNVKIHEVLTSAVSGVSNAAVEAKNTLPLASNPGILLLQILLSTRKGDNHATYDTGLANLAGGIPSALVNVDQIERWTARNFGSTSKHVASGLGSYHLGVDGEPESVSDAVKRILAPFQAVLIQGEAGKLEVISFADALPFLTDRAITEADILAPGAAITQDRRIEDAVDQLDIEYNAWPGAEADHLEVRNAYQFLRKLPGWTTAASVDMSGISTLDYARVLAEHMIVLYHVPIARITMETTRLASYWPGDVVQVSHSLIFGQNATRGVSAAAMLVVGRTEILSSDGHSIRYELDYVGALYNRQGRIAPSARVSSFVAGAGTGTITVVPRVYTHVDHGHFHRDVPDDTSVQNLFDAGDIIQVCNEYGTVIVGSEAVLVVAVSDDTLKVDAATYSTAPQADDIVRVSAYANCTVSQQSRWIWVADANNEVGASDLGYEYVGGEGEEG
jgi:hypothetical protein